MRVYLYSSVLNAASVLCVCNFSLRMKKHSSLLKLLFSRRFFFSFLSKKTKHLLASFFLGRSAAQNDDFDDDVMSCIFLRSTLL